MFDYFVVSLCQLIIYQFGEIASCKFYFVRTHIAEPIARGDQSTVAVSGSSGRRSGVDKSQNKRTVFAKVAVDLFCPGTTFATVAATLKRIAVYLALLYQHVSCTGTLWIQNA